MTRRDCYEYRGRCFEYLLKNGILPSSEEVNDWAVESQVFCHYAPYDFMMRVPGTPKQAIPVPLYNLVYHDCVIQPWMMEKVSEEEDYMLYALLNGGAPYLERDAAYPNIDGAFQGGVKWNQRKAFADQKLWRTSTKRSQNVKWYVMNLWAEIRRYRKRLLRTELLFWQTSGIRHMKLHRSKGGPSASLCENSR